MGAILRGCNPTVTICIVSPGRTVNSLQLEKKDALTVEKASYTRVRTSIKASEQLKSTRIKWRRFFNIWILIFILEDSIKIAAIFA